MPQSPPLRRVAAKASHRLRRPHRKCRSVPKLLHFPPHSWQLLKTAYVFLLLQLMAPFDLSKFVFDRSDSCKMCNSSHGNNTGFVVFLCHPTIANGTVCEHPRPAVSTSFSTERSKQINLFCRRQDRQYSHVHRTTEVFAVEKQYYIFRVCSLSYPAYTAHVPYYIAISGLSGSTIFFEII